MGKSPKAPNSSLQAQPLMEYARALLIRGLRFRLTLSRLGFTAFGIEIFGSRAHDVYFALADLNVAPHKLRSGDAALILP